MPMILYTIELNGRRYRTTREDKAWDFCLSYGGQMIQQTETQEIIDGVEQIERTWEEILFGLKAMLQWSNGPASRVVVKPLNTGRYKINEWPLDGD